jgi:hypothetical protein
LEVATLKQSFEQEEKWPMPKFIEDEEPHFVFIIAPPNSGSTALSELLNTSHRTMKLHVSGEGQWLIPGLCEPPRWDPNKEVNYKSVKAVWLNRFQIEKQKTPSVDVVIEKSPPNMVRIESLLTQFHNYSLIANNRNPYAMCSSILYRYNNAEEIGLDKRKNVLRKIANKWLARSKNIRELIKQLNIPLLTYEQFCQDPSSLLSILKVPNGVSETMNLQARVRVKDYTPQVISNQNDRQISKLTNEEVEHISAALEPNHQILDFFDYQILR